jgi:hypothetical protein
VRWLCPDHSGQESESSLAQAVQMAVLRAAHLDAALPEPLQVKLQGWWQRSQWSVNQTRPTV